MEITAFMLMRELIEMLERHLMILRSEVREGDDRDRFDRLARVTIQRATATVDLYEQEPFQERLAIGAMYAACEVGLELLHVIQQVSASARHQRRHGWAVRDLQSLISQLFEWVIAPGVDQPTRVGME
jgi:hypothetical protein